MVQQNLPTQLSILFSFFRMFQVPWQSPARTWLAAQLPERPMRGPSIGHRLFEALGALGPLPCDFDAVNAREVHLPTKKHQKNRWSNTSKVPEVQPSQGGRVACCTSEMV